MRANRIVREFILNYEMGLHARPAARLVKTASAYDAEISVGCQGLVVNAKSILGLLSLGVGRGQRIRIEAEGADAAEALQAISDLLAHSNDEDETTAALAGAGAAALPFPRQARSRVLFSHHEA
ncbi:MAG: HPr family phosphocarrier protein [Kiritimatiellia bacterium]